MSHKLLVLLMTVFSRSANGQPGASQDVSETTPSLVPDDDESFEEKLKQFACKMKNKNKRKEIASVSFDLTT